MVLWNKKYQLKSVKGFGGLGVGWGSVVVCGFFFPFNEYKDRSGENTTDTSKECYPGLKNIRLDLTAM